MRLRRPPEGAAAQFADAPRAGARTPWRDARWCALDLEMTGLDPRSDEIIAIGAVPIDDGRVVLGGGAYTLVRTSRRSEYGAVLVHKLRVPDLAQAPPLEEAMELLFGALAGRIPVCHTAAIERSFLERPFARRRVRMPAVADTEALGRLWLRHRDGGTPGGLGLGRLVRELGQPAETPHHALGDALTTAQAFIALASKLDAIEPQTVGSLMAAGESVVAARRFGPG
jgi:DNA polymerase-3 subunit epsilon